MLVTTLATLTLRFGGGEHPLEQCWIPSAGGFVGVYDSEETALREAKARVDWLMESGSEEQRSILKAGFALGVG